MIACQNNSDTAIVILHEIYGINEHIKKVCGDYRIRGYDVYCPNLLNRDKPFSYSEQEEAYQNFIENIGFDVCLRVNGFLRELRPAYHTILLVGYSIGATIAWRCSESGLCDGIIGYYGSRIRDYPPVMPKCKTLLIFAEREKSFDPKKLILNSELAEIKVLPGKHGFCDPFSENYKKESAEKAQALADEFCRGIIKTKENRT